MGKLQRYWQTEDNTGPRCGPEILKTDGESGWCDGDDVTALEAENTELQKQDARWQELIENMKRAAGKSKREAAKMRGLLEDVAGRLSLHGNPALWAISKEIREDLE